MPGLENSSGSNARIVIVGAGFAGAAIAWHLRSRGETDVIVLEREEAPGLQASGQNAAMARQSASDPVLTRLLAEGARFLAAPPKEFRAARPVFRRAGSALIGSKSQVDRLAGYLKDALPGGDFEVGPADRLGGISYISDTGAPAALYTRTDGYIDLDALLSGFLRDTRVVTRCELKSAVHAEDGWKLQTSQGPFRCLKLVLAAGAWSGLAGRNSGSAVLPVQPTTRHLFQTVGRPEFFREAPFVWDMRTDCYARPDGAGHLLVSACDQDSYDPATPLLPNPAMRRILREKLAATFPKLAAVPLRRFWCGTRVLTPDGRFILGPDPKAPSLYWAAGLGGHGVTAAPAVGRIVAESVLVGAPVLPELSAQRFFN